MLIIKAQATLGNLFTKLFVNTQQPLTIVSVIRTVVKEYTTPSVISV